MRGKALSNALGGQVHGSGGAVFFALTAALNYSIALSSAHLDRGWLGEHDRLQATFLDGVRF